MEFDLNIQMFMLEIMLSIGGNLIAYFLNTLV